MAAAASSVAQASSLNTDTASRVCREMQWMQFRLHCVTGLNRTAVGNGTSGCGPE